MDYFRLTNGNSVRVTDASDELWTIDMKAEGNYATIYDNGLWYSLQTNINQTPYEGSAYWELIYRGVITIYPVSETAPTTQQDGELWFKILT